MEDKIKGFSKDEIYELYRFVGIYESDIKNPLVDEICQKYPDFSERRWNEIMKNVNHIKVQNQNEYERDISENTLMDRNTGIERKDVMGHIRNGFAHYLIQKDSQTSRISLTDKYPKGRTGHYVVGDISAKYSFDESTFWNIIHIFIR